jgi:hypothetical protein
MSPITVSFSHDKRYCCKHARATKARKLKRQGNRLFRHYGRVLVRALIAGEDWLSPPRPITGYDVC